MKQLAVLMFVFVTAICLANTSWGQGCYQGGHHHGGHYHGGTSISVGFGNYGYDNFGYGYNSFYNRPAYGYGYGNGYPGYYNRVYSVPAVPYYRPGCGYGGQGGGIYFRW